MVEQVDNLLDPRLDGRAVGDVWFTLLEYGYAMQNKLILRGDSLALVTTAYKRRQVAIESGVYSVYVEVRKKTKTKPPPPPPYKPVALGTQIPYIKIKDGAITEEVMFK